mmetsp:Transcript_21516/g.45273  ORF Transcript_21516/g.45273 Transcript_21516/m.45273 type:complete len:449 (+) Transcript_21516:176-1522(+)|eukprot:CAMPEP_0168178238 /NCGR_PEP_ID=MMETSP0139_2-20121125/8983_1 /TAXON_ID=44445 /ORGANISM="Pseudo-nitzschia australis, Strain 10249 10 AB" /LENGTH=448 /DNA_ID=CAMNT_0008097547 /DNA_START=295 /DNA_END=1641 /DNA_ORIENTATION=-
MATKATKNKQHQNQQEALSAPCYYKLSAGELPDDLFRKEASVTDWIGGSEDTKNSSLQPWMKITSDPNGFLPGELRKVLPIDRMVDMERCIGISLYMVGNVAPFALPTMALTWLVLKMEFVKYLFWGVLIYWVGLYAIWRLCFVSVFLKRYNRRSRREDDMKPVDPWYSQYLFTERNVTKYCSTNYVWPASLQRPALEEAPNNDRPIIYCVIPHGLFPYGIVGYPYFSKVWNSKYCSWTCAPVLLKIPFVGTYLSKIGYIPAKSKNIVEGLTKKDHNIGIILDGIEGMFHNTNAANSDTEMGVILNRKGIVKIAIKANAAIVPVYGFGHAMIYDVWVDPFGIMKYLSSTFGMSLTPFFGRYGWFLGPPKRSVPITVCLGDPIYPPSNSSGDKITQEQIDEHHTKLLEGFRKVFETHKRGYYGEQAGAKKKLLFCKYDAVFRMRHVQPK